MDVFSSDTARRVIEHPTAHMRVLGPPGSGKTSLLIERFKTLQTRHVKSPGVFILTYSAESHRRLTNAVFEKNTAHVGPSRVLTYSRLAAEIIESAGGRSPLVVADLEEHLLLQNVIARCRPRLKSELRSICASERFGRDFLEICHLLLQNNVGGRSLAGLMICAADDPELVDLFVLYEEFREALASRKAVTYYDIAWHAAEAWRSGLCRHTVTNAAAILVEDFQDVDAGQFELLTSIAPPGGPVSLNVFGDPMGSVFAHRGTQHRYLMDEFPRLYGGETIVLSARSPDGGAPGATLEALLDETLEGDRGAYLPVVCGERGEAQAAPEGGAEPHAGDTYQGFHIEKARDEVDEVYIVAARIAELLRTDAFRAEDIAIVTNEKRRYEPFVSAAAAQRGIPLDTGRAAKRVFGDFVDALLSLIDSPDDAIAARAILTSPLFQYLRDVLPDEATAPREPVGVSESERRGDDAEDARARPRRAAEELRSFIDELHDTILSSDASGWMRAVVERCLRPVCAAYWKECEDDSVYQDVCRLLESWGRYAAAVSAWGGRASIAAFAALDAGLSKRRSPGAAGAVAFLSCREAKGRFFSAVFVLGCSELLFPSAGRSENVLPIGALEEALRHVFQDRPLDVYRARSAARQLSEEHHLLYIALTRSKGYLHVTAPEVFAGEDYPAPSAILARTIPDELCGKTKTEHETPPQVRFARAWAARRTVEHVDRRLDRLSPAGSHWHAPVPAAKPVRLTPFALSKSSLETFLACERRFFYRKVLRIPEAEAPPAKVGSLVHKIMATLGQRYPAKAALVTEATGSVIRDLIDEALRDDENVGRASFFDRSLRYHLERMVMKILDIERGDPESYAITAIEKDLRFTFGPWEFAGRIDRVHETPAGDKVVVDYKTGKFDKMAKTLRKKTLAALEDPKGANWQVPLYAWGVKTTEGSSPRAFTHIVTSPKEDPFAVTLVICRGAGDVPPDARKGKGPSYLLESEIEDVMGKTVEIAKKIFAPRSRFERTEDRSECRYCEFRGLCGREER